MCVFATLHHVVEYWCVVGVSVQAVCMHAVHVSQGAMLQLKALLRSSKRLPYECSICTSLHKVE